MARTSILDEDLIIRPHHILATQWMVLTSGDFSKGKFNSMAIGWGSLGTMWGKSFVHVVVRPNRYTSEFMEKYDTFTVCAFPEKYRKAVQVMGSKTGRKCDKVKESGLTPIASAKVAAPGYDEAELIIECKKIYQSKVDPAGFLDDDIAKNYPQKDYHAIYYGEVLAIAGDKKYKL